MPADGATPLAGSRRVRRAQRCGWRRSWTHIDDLPRASRWPRVTQVDHRDRGAGVEPTPLLVFQARVLGAAEHHPSPDVGLAEPADERAMGDHVLVVVTDRGAEEAPVVLLQLPRPRLPMVRW